MAIDRRYFLGAAAGTLCNSLLQAQPSAPEPLPIPKLEPGQKLRVVYAHNPRFDRPSSDLLVQILLRTQALCAAHLGLDVQFNAVQEQPIASLFRGISEARWNDLKRFTYDAKNGTGKRIWLVKELQKVLAANLSGLEAQMNFAKPYLVSGITPTDTASLAEALIDTQLARFAQWQAIQGSDGRPLIGEGVYHEYFAWLFAPRLASWLCEVVITNQLMASVEYLENSLHSALRGGVSNGLTVPSPNSRYGTVSILSLFPFTSQEPLTRQLRGDEPIKKTNTVEAAAFMLTHELGHQLRHLGHPFGSKKCIMNPPELLQFDAWMHGLNASQCPVGNSPENTPGVAKFPTFKPPP